MVPKLKTTFAISNNFSAYARDMLSSLVKDLLVTRFNVPIEVGPPLVENDNQTVTSSTDVVADNDAHTTAEIVREIPQTDRLEDAIMIMPPGPARDETIQRYMDFKILEFQVAKQKPDFEEAQRRRDFDAQQTERKHKHTLEHTERKLKHDAEEAERKLKHDAEEAERKLKHDAEESERKRKYDAEEAERKRKHEAEIEERRLKHEATENQKRHTHAMPCLDMHVRAKRQRDSDATRRKCSYCVPTGVARNPRPSDPVYSHRWMTPPSPRSSRPLLPRGLFPSDDPTTTHGPPSLGPCGTLARPPCAPH